MFNFFFLWGMLHSMICFSCFLHSLNRYLNYSCAVQTKPGIFTYTLLNRGVGVYSIFTLSSLNTCLVSVVVGGGAEGRGEQNHFGLVSK